jgi:molybdate transport system substrate-binding protein
MRMKRWAGLVCSLATVIALLVVAGCSAAKEKPAPSGDRLTGPLTVFAAASLTEAFARLRDEFRRDHPGVDVRISAGGSSGLAASIVQGAPADVFASANEAQMTVVQKAGRTAGKPELFAANTLEIAVPPGNPAGIKGLADFGREDLTLALCAPEVPCGAAAGKVLAAAGVTARPDTLEEDVRAALNKVELGEVDAALVYVTDVRSVGRRVQGLPFPESAQAVSHYPIAVLSDAPNPKAAKAFVDLVLSGHGRQTLAEFGFAAP